MPFSMNDQMLVGPAGLSALNLNLIDGVDSSWTDVSQFNVIDIQLIVGAISAGAVTFEFTNDSTIASTGIAGAYTIANNVTFVEVSTALTLVASSQNIYQIKVIGKFFRARISTALVGGTGQAVTYVSQSPAKNTANQRVLPQNGTFHTATLAASTNATSVAAAPATLTEICITNMTAAAIFFKLYAKASAPTVGTDIPIWTIQVPANSSVEREFGFTGKRVGTGLAYAVTAAQPDADVAAVGAGSKVSLTYI